MAAGMNLSLEALGVNLPYSMEAEQAVLGAAILDVENIPKMVETLRPEMFYARQNGEIFSEIVRLFYGRRAGGFCDAAAGRAGLRHLCH